MEQVQFAVTLVVGVVSVVLAIVAIWLGSRSEKQSAENYDRTKDLLAEVSQKAEVIKATVDTTQQKLVDTITDIARPQRESVQDKMMATLLPQMLQDPAAFQRFMEIAKQFEEKGKGQGG